MSYLNSLSAQPISPPSSIPHPALINGIDPWQLSRPKRPHRHSKKHKKHKKQRWGGYILQLIGLVCLVLAAFRAFEPLTGVGFTLVMIGYKGGVSGDRSKSKKSDRKRHKKTKRRHVDKGGGAELKVLKLEADGEIQ